MKAKIIGTYNWHDAADLCNRSQGEFRLPTITELETLIKKYGSMNTSFWSSSEDETDSELVWTGSLVNGTFWRGDSDHETTAKSNLIQTLVIIN